MVVRQEGKVMRMKSPVRIIMMVLAAALFAVASFAWAQPTQRGSSNYARCIKGCDMAKATLLRACNKNKDPAVKKQCKTMGTKKLMSECRSRCKKTKE
jgi:hypothetical protein